MQSALSFQRPHDVGDSVFLLTNTDRAFRVHLEQTQVIKRGRRYRWFGEGWATRMNRSRRRRTANIEEVGCLQRMRILIARGFEDFRCSDQPKGERSDTHSFWDHAMQCH